jgi:hypothetical protein
MTIRRHRKVCQLLKHLSSKSEEYLRNIPLLKLLHLHQFRRGGCTAEGGGCSEASAFGRTVREGWRQSVGTGRFFFGGGGGGGFYVCWSEMRGYWVTVTLGSCYVTEHILSTIT